jgi:hypothetical protein
VVQASVLKCSNRPALALGAFDRMAGLALDAKAILPPPCNNSVRDYLYNTYRAASE